jgi:hypothetical protein
LHHILESKVADEKVAEPICEMWGVWFEDPATGKSGWVSQELAGNVRLPSLYWPKERTEMVCIDARYQPRKIALIPSQ